MAATLFLAISVPVCVGQVCSTTHTTDLYCLLPTAFHTASAPFNAFFTPFGTELSELPTARPAGMVLTFDKGLLVPANESLGAVFAERAETLGRGRVFLGFTYQNFTFDTIDGNNLKKLPIVLTLGDISTVTQNRFDIRVGQYTAVLAAGLTSRVDVSVAVPFERVSMAVTVQGTEYGLGATAPVNEKVPGSSSGIGDVVLSAKAHLFERKSLRLASGVDVRIPSGDELNFLGSGTVGVRPFIAVSRHGRVSPKGNVGYQWNGDSILNSSASGVKQRLPTDFFYTVGVNVEVSKRWTLMADVLGRHLYDAPRLTAPVTKTYANAGAAQSVQPTIGSYTTNDLSVGFKARSIARLIVTGNVTFKLDQGGLRAKATPLVGVSYSF